MIAARHTPGPWEQNIQSCGFWSICTVYGTDQGWVEIHAPNGSYTEDHRAESTANARLIAAAPELLEALKEIAADYADRFDLDDPSTNPGIKSTIKQARAAIAKATGGAA